jgi:hypothetical protein
MNTVFTTPEVKLFVRAVRERLVDLTEEEREELVGGLDADMSDLVAERGVDALPEPADYAAELRAAAGFSPVAAPVRERRGAGERVTGALDAAHARWDALVAGLPGDPWGLAQVLRPLWWVTRAWVALQLVDLFWGRGGYGLGLSPVPSLMGLGLPLLLVAVLVSVQVGRGKLWPGRPRSGGWGRLVLLLLNVVAVLGLPLTLDNVATPARMGPMVDDGSAYQQGYDDARSETQRQGMYVDGRWVSNIYPYDAAGKPVVGVQLFDQTGKPVSVRTAVECVYDEDGAATDQVRVPYPWATATGQARNVFPVPSRVQGVASQDPDPNAFTGDDKPQVGRFPLPGVPAAALPGLAVSTATTPPGAFTPGTVVQQPINPVDAGC